MYKIFENDKSGGGNMTMEGAACQALKDELVDWKSWLKIHDRCLGQSGAVWSEDKRQCVRKSSLLVPVVAGILCFTALLLALLALLLLRQRSLRNYVHMLEDAAMGNADPTIFESPVMLAANALKVRSS
jgi:hypothetical protein